MSGTPETLADIAAEIRHGERMFWSLRDCAAYADRIEAAAERERDEDRLLAAIAESDEAFARCARCDRPERAPGNAAAMREALTAFVDYLTQRRIDEVWAKTTLPEPGLDRLVEQARAALAAPPRNCDVGNAAEQSERLAKFCNANFEKAKKDKHICSECRFNDCPGECQLEWAQLPFTPGKGGAE